MSDTTETRRRVMVDSLNDTTVDEIKGSTEQTWTTQEMQEEFTVEGFMAPYVVVRRKDNGETGTLMFKHSPRIYFGYQKA